MGKETKDQISMMFIAFQDSFFFFCLFVFLCKIKKKCAASYSIFNLDAVFFFFSYEKKYVGGILKRLSELMSALYHLAPADKVLDKQVLIYRPAFNQTLLLNQNNYI